MSGWIDGPLLGFDTETTGVDPLNDRIVTAALVLHDTHGREGADWLIDPGVPIPAAATKVHGITDEQARAQGAAPGPALDAIANIIALAMTSGIPVVAFNARFDLSILRAELVRHGLPTLEDRVGRGVRPVIDPLTIDRAIDRRRKGKRTLGDVCRVYSVTTERELHSADVDVHATLDVLTAMGSATPGLGDLGVTELHDWQAARHLEWAASFNAWLVSRGRLDDPVPLQWP